MTAPRDTAPRDKVTRYLDKLEVSGHKMTQVGVLRNASGEMYKCKRCNIGFRAYELDMEYVIYTDFGVVGVDDADDIQCQASQMNVHGGEYAT